MRSRCLRIPSKAMLVAAVVSTVMGGCTNVRSIADRSCGQVPVTALDGTYANEALNKVGARNLLLSQILWPDERQLPLRDHRSIDRVELRWRDGTLLGRAFAGESVVRAAPADPVFRMIDGELELHTDFSVLPDPGGGLFVGPRHLRVTLSADCQRSAVATWRQTSAGLMLMLIPAGGRDEWDLVFPRRPQ
jgi:uncharacterized protein YceK